jgi:hypothetical protein
MIGLKNTGGKEDEKDQPKYMYHQNRFLNVHLGNGVVVIIYNHRP